MIDFEKIKLIYKFGRNLTLADIQVLFKTARLKSYATGTILIQKDTLKKDIFFLKKGLVRVYHINDRGDEITTALRWENKLVASVDTILHHQPSQFYYEALEPTEAFHVDYDVLDSIISNNPKLAANRQFILLNLIKDLSYRVHSFVLLSPEERYLDFIKENPDIINRVPNKYIANVLGITPVSLSRIRKRIASRNTKQ